MGKDEEDSVLRIFLFRACNWSGGGRRAFYGSMSQHVSSTTKDWLLYGVVKREGHEAKEDTR